MNQQKFINDLISGVKENILAKDLPEHWDGIELRQFIAEQFAECVAQMPPKRLEQYQKDVYSFQGHLFKNPI